MGLLRVSRRSVTAPRSGAYAAYEPVWVLVVVVIHPGVPLEPNNPRVPLSNPSFKSGPHGPGVRVNVGVGIGAVHVTEGVRVMVLTGVRVIVGE